MIKVVNESLDSFISERKKASAYFNPGKPSSASSSYTSHGPIRNTIKVARTAPARALRRKRARKIMEKYKNKIIKKIDKVLNKYIKNLDIIEEKVNNRISRIKSSNLPEESKSNQYEELLRDLRSSMENILHVARNTANKYLEVYSEAIRDRLQRKGTITGTEFTPEDKILLLGEWQYVEDEINYYVEKKLLDFLDYKPIEGLSEIKAKLRSFIEGQKGYVDTWNPNESDPITLSDPDQKKIWNYFEAVTGFNLDTPIKLRYPKKWSDNHSSFPYFRFVIREGQLGTEFMKPSSSSAGPFKVIKGSFIPLEPETYKTKLKEIQKAIG